MKPANRCKAAVSAQLSRTLASPEFREAPRLRALLHFLISTSLDGKSRELKELTIASEVFGRVGTGGDSLVRSAVGRLRARLEEYYQRSGARDEIVFFIPRGSYVPEITERRTGENSEIPQSRWRLSWRWAAAAIALATAVAAGAVLFRQRPAARERALNGEARELCLQGRFYWTRRTPEDLSRAVDRFTQAVVKDPSYAEAYVGLADSYNLLSEYTTMPYGEAFRRAISAAGTALKLDDKSAAAHRAYAFAAFYGQWDAVKAERELRRALEIDPRDATAHHWYATFLMSTGRVQEAQRQISQAQELEPASNSILADKGLILLWAGKISAARTLLEELEASDPEFDSPHRYLAAIDMLQGRYEQYVEESKQAAAIRHDADMMAIARTSERGLREGGVTGMFEEMRRALNSAARDETTRYYWFAEMSGAAGATEQSLEYLQIAFRYHDPNLVGMRADPCLARLRGRSDFRKLMARVESGARGGD